jgi:hypothetical protein
MNNVSRGILAVAFVLVAVAPRARAESDQYCFDYVRSVESQLQRAAAAKCNVQEWGWSADAKVHFAFCGDNDAGTIEYSKNQRESQLKLCEAQSSLSHLTYAPMYPPEDIRITGGPGDYTIHWTIRTMICPHTTGFDSHCFVQIRLETPPGRFGDFAHQRDPNPRPLS